MTLVGVWMKWEPLENGSGFRLWSPRHASDGAFSLQGSQ